jgi:hypothetical protein
MKHVLSQIVYQNQSVYRNQNILPPKVSSSQHAAYYRPSARVIVGLQQPMLGRIQGLKGCSSCGH